MLSLESLKCSARTLLKDFVATFCRVLSGLLNTKNERKVELAADLVASVHGLC